MVEPSPSSSALSKPTQGSVHIPRTSNTHHLNVQDPDLRSQINAQLLAGGHIDKIHAHLTRSLSAHPSNFPTQIRTHALHLLRTDPSITTFPVLMSRVLADVQADTVAARAAEAEHDGSLDGDVLDLRGTREGGSLEVPRVVMEEGIRVTREALEQIVEVEP